jgi:hypothetical protein
VTKAAEEQTAALLDLQTLWAREAEGWAADAMRPWLEGTQPVAGAAAEELLEAPHDYSPVAMLGLAQRAWTATGQAWMNALGHDVRGGR